MNVHHNCVENPIRLLPSLDAIYPYLLDSASRTEEDRRGITSDLFQQKHHMFFVRPSLPRSTALAEVKISPFAIVPERNCDEDLGGCGGLPS